MSKPRGLERVPGNRSGCKHGRESRRPVMNSFRQCPRRLLVCPRASSHFAGPVQDRHHAVRASGNPLVTASAAIPSSAQRTPTPSGGSTKIPRLNAIVMTGEIRGSAGEIAEWATPAPSFPAAAARRRTKSRRCKRREPSVCTTPAGIGEKVKIRRWGTDPRTA